MCDSVVIRSASSVWLAKNSDREPGEAQSVEWRPAASAPASRHARRRCTHVDVDDVGPRHALVISRPAWMWGAEMGVNERGLAIANEAVFTRMPVADRGLTGMDLLRLALERAGTAAEGLEVITGLLRRHPQGGSMGHRDRRFRYHSTFLLADGAEAWVLETAGWLWAARRIEGCHSASNVLAIGSDHDRIHPEAATLARARGWWKGGGELDFARAFGDPVLAVATGGHERRRGTQQIAAQPGDPFERLARTLRSHHGRPPTAGWRMQTPCAHSSWWPTRRGGQTTGSMIARAGSDARVWMTGTSSPCLSVFKPVAIDRDVLGRGHVPAERPDGSLWWEHERFHRCVMARHDLRASAGARERAQLEARARELREPERFVELWNEHRDRIHRWHAVAEGRGRPRRGPSWSYWRRMSRLDGLA